MEISKMKKYSDVRWNVEVALVIVIVSFTAQIIAFDGVVQPTICQKLTTSHCSEGGECAERYIEIECHHGMCSNLTGECLCSPCWTGEKCDTLENSHIPAFEQEQLYVDINVNKLHEYKNNIVATLTAKDHDSHKCPSSGHDCPCATVLYSIEKGNEDSLFMIDPRKGELSLSLRGGDKPRHGKSYEFIISARNPVHRSRGRRMVATDVDEQLKSTSNIAVTVNFVVTNEVPEAEVAHSRRRRSANDVPEAEVAHSRRRRSAGAGIASDVTFVLEKLDPWTSQTSILVGERVPFRLTIWLPQQSFTAQVELLTQYESSAIMSICDPQIVHIGGNYGSFTASDATIEMNSTAGDYRYDRVVIDLGTIANDATNGDDQIESEIQIEFYAVMEYNNATQYGDDYWVSAGVIYDGGNEIWVGQTSFTAVDDIENWVYKAPVITMNGPSELSKSTATNIIIDIVIENIGFPSFYVDVITTNHTTDPIMLIGNLEFAEKGDSFECLPYELPQFSAVYDNDTGLFSHATLDFDGSIVNPGFRSGEQNDQKNTLTLKASVYLTSSSDIVVGEDYWLGMAMYNREDTLIYSQQIPITATDDATATMVESPQFEFYAVDGYHVINGGGIGFVLNIYTRPGTSHLIVDMSLPYESSASIMHLWRASMIYNGRNIPCVGNLMPVYFREDNTYVDYIQYDFGRITNLDWKNPNHVDPDLLQVHFSAQLLGDHASVSNGSEFFVQAGVRYGLVDKDVFFAAEIPVYTLDQQYNTYTAPEKQARFWITNRAADNMLYNDTTVSFDLTMYIPPGTTYTPLNVNISAERNEDGRPLFKFCSLTLEKLGDNFHLTPVGSIDMNTYSTEDGIVSDYSIDFGLVSNTMPPERAGHESNSYFSFEVRASWLNHDPWLENGTIVSAAVNITYGPEGFWNDTMDYEISYDMPNLEADDNEPTFSLALDEGRNNFLKAHQLGVYYLDTDVPPDSVAAYFVDVNTPNETLSVCAVRLVSAGSNMPCFETSRVVNYWSYDEDYHRDRGYLEIGAVRNIGYESETRNKADDLMVTQVVVKLEEAALPPDNLTAPEQQLFYVTSRVGEDEMFTEAQAIDVDVTPVSTNLTTKPEMTLTKHTAVSRVTKGGGVVFDLDMYIPYDTAAYYGVTFQSDHTDPYRTTICSARIISSGWNIPCVNGSFLIPEFSSTTGDGHIDLGFLDAQNIANMEIEANSNTPLMDKMNKVRVQLIARLEANDTHIEEGDQIWVEAVVNLNGYNEYMLAASFNATESVTYDETKFEPEFQIDVDNRNVSMTIGSKETYYIKITTPPMTTPMVLNITMPTDGDEAILTIKEMDYYYIGENYACYDRLKLEPEYDSRFNTSQNTSAIVDLGVLMNHGTSHIYQYYPGKQEDNEMIISLEVQLADNYYLVDGDTVEFDVEFQYSLNRSHVITEQIIVNKTGDEVPELDFNLTLIDYDPWELHQEDNLKAMITVYHTNASEAHAHGVFVYFMIPYYIEIDENIEMEGPLFCVKTSPGGVQFHFEEMFFTDTFTMWFNFTLDPERVMPMEWVFVNTTVPLEVVYFSLKEINPNGSVVLDTGFKTKTELLDLTFTIEDCFDSLGLESGQIVDCQMKSSSMYNVSYDPHYGRLNDASGWSPAYRHYPPYKGNEYFEVTFGGSFRFAGIKMQIGPQGNDSFVSSYRLSYSDSGLIWEDYMENDEIKIFHNDFYAINDTDYNVTTEVPWVLNRLESPFNAISVRIIPLTYNNTNMDANSTATDAIPVVRFELMGCQRDPDIQAPEEFCEDPPNLPDYGYYERGFLVEPTSGFVYVCILEYVDGPTRCSLSRDNGTSWEAMDTNVANVLAVHHDDIDLEIFGLSQNKKALMRSDDLGVTWYTVFPERYFEFLETEPENIREAVRVPFENLPSDPPRTFILNNDMIMEGNRSFVEWGAGAEGLYRRDMTLEEYEEVVYPPESTTPADSTATTGTSATTIVTTQAPQSTEESTEETTTGMDEILVTMVTTEEPYYGPRNVTRVVEYPSEWELLGVWAGPEEN
ncbi:uncharacterized protein [Amphiura filiformis]|uniref:uncharacterized protein n=1 Tax=Amphiura filiformis TaxID=82378 RepID=UPI003B221B72